MNCETQTSKLYMAEEAKERDWKVQSIRSQHVDSETTVNASETEQDSAFWWQFKKKVEVS